MRRLAMLALAVLAHVLAASPGLAQEDPVLARTRAAFEAHRKAFARYDPNVPASVEEAEAGLVALFSAGGDRTNIEHVHELLKDGTIDEATSRRLANARNAMVDRVLVEMALENGEIHVMNFSPAENLLNDIDQTFRPSERMAEIGRPRAGGTLKTEFNRRFREVFGVAPERLDVVSHAAEATIPDWGVARETHRFVADLRTGSRLLKDNPEAYFLEGAFRMQVERRSFESDLELYSILAADPTRSEGVLRAGAIVRRQGTIRELSYRLRSPEARKSYAAGSAVGNWIFMTRHGGGTRYAAKYGLRSFSEGPGWVYVFEADPDVKRPQPWDYEKIESAAERRAYVEEVHRRAYAGAGLSLEEVHGTLETAREIRLLGDRFRPDEYFRAQAVELAGGEAAFGKNPRRFLDLADRRFRNTTARMMIRNMEVTLPHRLADWLDPQVDTRRLGLTPEQLRRRGPEVEAAIEAARKRLRTAALFEVMHALRVLDARVRKRVLESALAQIEAKAAREGKPFRFERAVRAVLRLAAADAEPNLLRTDAEAGRRVVVSDGGRRMTVEVSDAPDRSPAGFAHAVEAVRRELAAALAEGRLDAEDGPAREARQRWAGSADEHARDDRLRRIATPEGRRRALLDLRHAMWEHLGWKAQANWEALVADPRVADPVKGMEFDGRELAGSIANLNNVASLINVIAAWDAHPDDPDARAYAVREAILTEVVTRLPLLGEGLLAKEILEGNVDPIWGTATLVVPVYVPALGPVIVAYGAGSTAWSILSSRSLRRQAKELYQGVIPDDDASAGPGASENPMWKDVRGALEPVLEWMAGRRRALLEAHARADAASRREIEDHLAARFPASPTLRHVRASVYACFHPRIERALEEARLPRERWVEYQLGAHHGDIAARLPADRREVPLLVKAVFRRFATDYFRGEGAFAALPGHAEAHAHPLLREMYFADGGPLEKPVDDLAEVLAESYCRSFYASTLGEDTSLVIHEAQDADAEVAASAYLFGLEARRFAGADVHFRDAPPPPDLPAFLDVVGATDPAEQRARFFRFFDDYIDARLRERFERVGAPAPEEWAEAKLGPWLRPTPSAEDLAADEKVRHPLLNAFFRRHVLEQWKAALEPDGRGELESVPASGQMEPRDRREALDDRKEEIVEEVVQLLVADYKAGLLQELADRKRLAAERRTDQLLGPAADLAAMRDAVFGDPDDPSPRPLAGVLAEHARMPSPFLPDDVRDGLLKRVADWPTDVRIEIANVPAGPLRPGDRLDLRCEVRAAGVAYERPFRVAWSVERAGKASRGTEHVVSLPLGDRKGGIAERDVTIVATVTDATGRPMGERKVTVRIGALDAPPPPREVVPPAVVEQEQPAAPHGWELVGEPVFTLAKGLDAKWKKGMDQVQEWKPAGGPTAYTAKSRTWHYNRSTGAMIKQYKDFDFAMEVSGVPPTIAPGQTFPLTLTGTCKTNISEGAGWPFIEGFVQSDRLKLAKAEGSRGFCKADSIQRPSDTAKILATAPAEVRGDITLTFVVREVGKTVWTYRPVGAGAGR